MSPEKYIKRYALKHNINEKLNSSILCYSLVYIKRHKTLYYFDIINNNEDFEIKILNKSNKKTLIDQLKDMFIFENELNDEYDYQEIKLCNKLKIETNEKIGRPILGFKNKDLILINNYNKSWIKKI